MGLCGFDTDVKIVILFDIKKESRLKNEPAPINPITMKTKVKNTTKIYLLQI
jgi:hypothetical protein